MHLGNHHDRAKGTLTMTRELGALFPGLSREVLPCRLPRSRQTDVVSTDYTGSARESSRSAKRVFRYLKKIMALGLVHHSSPSKMPRDVGILVPHNTLGAYVDFDWAGSCRSTSGFVFMLNRASISWRSKRQPCMALSSAEAEFISPSAMIPEMISASFQ